MYKRILYINYTDTTLIYSSEWGPNYYFSYYKPREAIVSKVPLMVYAKKGMESSSKPGLLLYSLVNLKSKSHPGHSYYSAVLYPV